MALSAGITSVRPADFAVAPRTAFLRVEGRHAELAERLVELKAALNVSSLGTGSVSGIVEGSTT